MTVCVATCSSLRMSCLGFTVSHAGCQTVGGLLSAARVHVATSARDSGQGIRRVGVTLEPKALATATAASPDKLPEDAGGRCRTLSERVRSLSGTMGLTLLHFRASVAVCVTVP